MRSRCVAQLALSSLPDTIALCVAGPPGSQSSRSRQLATSGYATFGEHVASDVLVSYPRTPFVAVTRLALAVVVSASYPLMSHPARESAMSLLSATARRGALEPPASRAFRAVSAAHLAGTLAIVLPHPTHTTPPPPSTYPTYLPHLPTPPTYPTSTPPPPLPSP